MIQIVPSDSAGADDLAAIVDPLRDTVMAARPDAEVDCLAVAPEGRMRVDVRGAGVARYIAGDRSPRSGSRRRTGGYRQLMDRRHAVGVRNVTIPR